MPLKETDLRSLDACKRAFRQDTQSIRMGAALRFWIYQKVGVENETFALFPVLVDDRGVRNLLAKNGSTVLCHGVCTTTRDGRALVFETESRELNATVLKKVVGTLMNAQEVVVRVVGGAQGQKGGAAPPHP